MAANGKAEGFEELRRIDRRKRRELEKAKQAEPVPDTLGEALRGSRAFVLPTPEERAERERKRLERIAAEARQRTAVALARLSADCGERLASASLDGFEVYSPSAMNRTLSALRRYVDSIADRVAGGDGLFLIGPPGTGKDHLAIAVARLAIAELAISARWLDASSLRMELRDSIKSSDQERRIFAPYLGAGILILSDPVAPGDGLSAYQADALFRLIDGRYRHKRPTFVTANFRDIAEASSALGSQVVDRLSHGGLRLKCVWESYRTKGRK